MQAPPFKTHFVGLQKVPQEFGAAETLFSEIA
jgi:hypothetical protein